MLHIFPLKDIPEHLSCIALGRLQAQKTSFWIPLIPFPHGSFTYAQTTWNLTKLPSDNMKMYCCSSPLFLPWCCPLEDYDTEHRTIKRCSNSQIVFLDDHKVTLSLQSNSTHQPHDEWLKSYIAAATAWRLFSYDWRLLIVTVTLSSLVWATHLKRRLSHIHSFLSIMYSTVELAHTKTQIQLKYFLWSE